MKEYSFKLTVTVPSIITNKYNSFTIARAINSEMQDRPIYITIEGQIYKINIAAILDDFSN